MAVPQQVIDLFNLSLPALRHLALQAGKKIPAGATKAEVIEALSDLPRKQLEQDAADLLYAGNTSITWVQLASGKFTVDELKTSVAAVSEGDPFAGALRPTDVGYTPQIVEARQWGADKVVLTFVVRKRVQTVIRNFELQPVYADDFFQVIVRPSAGMFEIRASHDRARVLTHTWLATLAERMDTHVVPTPISYDEFDKLRGELQAVLDGYKGKDSSGSIYDTLELSRAEDYCTDLALEQRFKDDTKNYVPLSADITFTPDGHDHQVRLKVSANGSVWFRTVVSETVIDEVYEALRLIDAL